LTSQSEKSGYGYIQQPFYKLNDSGQSRKHILVSPLKGASHYESDLAVRGVSLSFLFSNVFFHSVLVQAHGCSCCSARSNLCEAPRQSRGLTIFWVQNGLIWYADPM